MLRTIIQEYFKQHENRMITKFGEIERSVQFMSDSFEEQKTKFEAIMEETKALRVENNKLKERIRSLETRFDDLEVEKEQIIFSLMGYQNRMNKYCKYSEQDPRSYKTSSYSYRMLQIRKK
nr:unnamed protein product [Callosobruchus analis]